MDRLPIDVHLRAIAASLRETPVLVLEAPPGAGKTTRVPPLLLDEGLAGSGVVLVLEPRRVAARAAARRVAAERGWVLGEEVGYKVRFDDRTSRRTRLAYLTEGILTRTLQSDPLLDGVGAVVLDEVHERSVHADLALALLREVRAARPELVLVAMSATLRTGPIAAYLGGCPVVGVEGRAHPVEVIHDPRQDARPLHARVASAVRRAVGAPGDDGGDLLVFLPGKGEIGRAMAALAPIAESAGLAVLPMHSGLSAEDQDRALAPSRRRKVVLATNIAETSLTIPGVTTVIDSGLERSLRHDPRHGIDRLELGRISAASAEQRAGRAGRTAPGRALRLWTRGEQATLVPETTPEIRRVDLSSTVLELHAWGVRDVARFAWLEAPAEAAIASADRLLRLLGALGAVGAVTPLGRALVSLPLHPRLGRLLLAAHRASCLRLGATLAALASEPDIIRDRLALEAAPTGSSDLLVRVGLLEQLERRGFDASVADGLGLASGAARSVARTRDKLEATARRVLGRTAERPPDEETALRLMVSAFADRICRRRAPGSPRARMVGGHGVALSPESVVREAELFAAVTLGGPPATERAETQVSVASEVREAWLAELLPGALHEEATLAFDAERCAVVASRQHRFEDLVLAERPARLDDPHLAERAARVLADAAAADLRAALPLTPAVEQLQARIECLARACPELGLPSLGDEALRSLLPDLCAGRRSFAELAALPLESILRARLSFQQARALDELAPERLEVPSGSRIRLDYQAEGPPILAVRLQEMFGERRHPTIANGRVAVRLHLLSPALRPMQITSDLAGFWERTYPEVRKELRGRYPKHAWPEDPLTAPPRRRPGRR